MKGVRRCFFSPPISHFSLHLMENITNTLTQAGLTEAQAVVYTALLKYGEQKAGPLTKKTPLKRGLVYKSLEDLVAFGLAEKKEDPGKVAVFLPKHPSNLRELVESRTKALQEAESVLEGLLPNLTSEYNLLSGTPGVLVYEGKEGIEKVLEDSLTSRTEILSYADIDAIARYIPQENKAYAKKREHKDISKRGIVLDTPLSREYLKNYHKLVTDTRFLKTEQAHHFESVMMIYDNKISYLTLTEKQKIGVIIADPQLYTLHKTLFETIWKTLGGGPKEKPAEEMVNPEFH